MIEKSCSCDDLTGSDWVNKTGFICFLDLFQVGGREEVVYPDLPRVECLFWANGGFV